MPFYSHDFERMSDNFFYSIKWSQKSRKSLKILANLESAYVNFSKLLRTDHLFSIPDNVAAEKETKVKNRKVEASYLGIFVNYLTQIYSNDYALYYLPARWESVVLLKMLQIINNFI